MRPDERHIDGVLNGWLDDSRDGPNGGIVHCYPLVVQFEDTDAGGIVYHANYIAFAERARSALLRCLGIDLHALLKRDEGIIIRKIGVAYKAPSHLGERLLVTTSDFKLGRAALNMRQVIGGTGTTLVDGDGHDRAVLDVEGAFVSAGVPCAVPEDIRGKMQVMAATSRISQVS